MSGLKKILLEAKPKSGKPTGGKPTGGKPTGGKPTGGKPTGGKPAPAPAQPAPAQPETGDNPVYTEIKKDYPKIAIYSRLFIFFTDNGKFFLNSQDADFGDILVNTNDKKMQLGYNLPTAFIKSVVEKYPQIIKVSVPEKIGNDNVELQFEFFKRIKGLQTILEQAQTPTKYITYKIVDGLLKKPTDDDNWMDATYKTIKSIAGGGTEVRKGERSDTVVRVKEALGYTKDTTPYFTEDFNTFVYKYKGTNKLDNTNGNIDQDLICSIEQYKRYCPATGAEKTTAPPTNTTTSKPTNTTDSTPIELKYLNDYATYVGTGIPSYGNCKSLFDYYSEQALNYKRLKKVNKAPQITPEQLKPIQDKILYCQKSSNLTDRAKLDTLISQRFRIQQDKDSPYYLDI